MSETYPLRTLRDIFELPSRDHMERCLGELTKMLLATRAAADLLIDSAKEAGIDIPTGTKAIEFPEVLDWIDDEKGELGCNFVTEDGTNLLRIEVNNSNETQADHREAGA